MMRSAPVITIKAKNPTTIARKALKMVDKLASLEVAHKKISIMLDRWVQLAFRSEGNQGNIGGWAPIQRDGRILQDKGRLRASFIPFFDEKDAGIGSELPYAVVHEEGKGVTKRRMLPIMDEVRRDVTAVYNKHVEDSIK